MPYRCGRRRRNPPDRRSRERIWQCLQSASLHSSEPRTRKCSGLFLGSSPMSGVRRGCVAWVGSFRLRRSCPALRAGRSVRAWSHWQVGPGLGSPALGAVPARFRSGSVLRCLRAPRAGRIQHRHGQAVVATLERRRACDPSPNPPCRSTHMLLEGLRASAHLGPRQLAGRPHAANFVALRWRAGSRTSPCRAGHLTANACPLVRRGLGGPAAASSSGTCSTDPAASPERDCV